MPFVAIAFRVSLVVFIAHIVGCSPAFSLGVPDGLKKETLKIGDRSREYLLYIPESTKNAPPILMSLHGGGGRMSAQARMFPFHREGAGKEWIVVYPQGVRLKRKANWNDGRVHTQKGRSEFESVDDEGFFLALLTSLRERYGTPAGQVYLHGVSNGAFMVHRMAAAHSGKLAAIAPVIGSMPEPSMKRFQPTEPVAVLMLNGTEDPLVPYTGDRARFGKLDLGKTYPAEEVVSKWAGANSCNSIPKTEKLPDSDPTDDCRVERWQFLGCKRGGEVEFLKLIGGGHTSPGDMQWAPKLLIGNTCRDINSVEVIMDFFHQHYLGSLKR